MTNSVLGHQRPRIEHRPLQGIRNHADEIAVTALLCGVELDDWQEYLLSQATMRRPDGKWSAYEVGFEVARQNGKSGLIEARILWGLFFNPREKTIIYSAHLFSTTLEIFTRLESLVLHNPKLAAQVKDIRHGNTGRQIVLKDGSLVKFMARTGKSARGFSGDLIIFDEAYDLESSMLEAMRPTLAARSITGEPQLWFASSAGMPDSTVLNGMRSRVIEEPDVNDEPAEHTILQHGHEPKLLWMEWSGHPSADSDDLEARRRANPALGKRISLEFLDDELRAFRAETDKGEEGYRREYLGIRPLAVKAAALSLTKFKATLDPRVELPQTVALAVDVTPSRDYAVVSVAGLTADGRILIEVVDQNVGTEWLMEALPKLRESLDPVRIIVNAGEAAGALEPELKRAGVPVTMITMRQYAQACAQFLDDFQAERLVTRVEQEVLLDAVKAATMRWFGDSLFRWNRKNPLENIAPLVAVTLAVRGLQYRRNKQARELGIGGKKKRPRRLGIGY